MKFSTFTLFLLFAIQSGFAINFPGQSNSWATDWNSFNSSETTNEISYIVYPNPAEIYTNIKFSTPVTGEIKIFNLIGKEVYQTKVNEEQLINISLDQFESGLYMIQAKVNNEVITQSFYVK